MSDYTPPLQDLIDTYTYMVETRNLMEMAQDEVRVARENGVDPLDIAETHRAMWLLIQLVVRETEAE